MRTSSHTACFFFCCVPIRTSRRAELSRCAAKSYSRTQRTWTCWRTEPRRTSNTSSMKKVRLSDGAELRHQHGTIGSSSWAASHSPTRNLMLAITETRILWPRSIERTACPSFTHSSVNRLEVMWGSAFWEWLLKMSSNHQISPKYSRKLFRTIQDKHLVWSCTDSFLT